MAGFGSFNDGQTARRQEVEVVVEPAVLVIRDLAGQELARWRFDELSAVDEAPPRGSLRLRNQEDDGARLIIADAGLVAGVTARAPQLLQVGSPWRGVRRIGVLAVLCLVVFALLFLFVLPQASGLLARAVPVGWEETLGERLSEQVVEMIGSFGQGGRAVCRSAAGEEALERLTTRLAAAVDSPYRYRVAVLDVNLVNAFALPGGYIFFFDGLLDKATSPNEVVGVLAHEMGHVIHRHGTEALIRETGLSLAFGAMFGEAGQGMAGGLGETLLSLSYSRDAELEADRTAVTLLQSAGIDVAGLAGFFRQIDREHGDLPGGLSFLSTHPPSGARADLIEQAGGGGDTGMSEADWQALKGICGS